MHTEPIFLIGAGGHGKVVLDALFLSGVRPSQIRLRDDARMLQGLEVMDCTVETPAMSGAMAGARFHLAIGRTEDRQRLFAQLTAMGAKPLTVTHPRAVVSPFATIGQGTFIAAQAVIAASARVGDSVIINHGAVVDHDCTVGSYTHIAPGATLGGAVQVGSGVMVGAGAAVLPGIVIGDNAVIGAGAVVTKNVAAGETQTGVPARRVSAADMSSARKISTGDSSKKKMKILFMGRKAVSAAALRYLCDRGDVEVVGVLTDNHLDVSPTSDVARRHDLRIFSFDEALAAVDSGSLKFDLGISILYWRKLRGGFLSVPACGTINFHPAPLPEYKGTAGYNLAILQSLDEWGVTVHYMDAEIDTGKIIEVAKFPIDRDSETVASLERTSSEVLFELFVKTTDRIIATRSLLPAMPNKGGVYVSRAEMEAMKKIVPGDDVPRKVRAFWYPPYDGAYVEMDGKKFTLVDQDILRSLADPTASSLFTKAGTTVKAT
jgi:methionyl-tRNA formyltransferase